MKDAPESELKCKRPQGAGNDEETKEGSKKEVPNNLAHEERRGVDRITDEERARNDSVDPRVEPKTRK